MREIKREKIAEMIHRLVAKFVQEVSSPASLITITRVELSSTGKEAEIFFTTIPKSQEETAGRFLSRKTSDFRRYAHDHSMIGMLPHFSFKIDYGERNRQRLDESTVGRY